METTMLENLFKGATGVIASATSLIAGLVQLKKAFGRTADKATKRKPGTVEVRNDLVKPWPLAFGLALVLLSAVLFWVPNTLAQANAPKATPVQGTAAQSDAVTPCSSSECIAGEAWKAFNTQKWALAISKADECIKAYQDYADEQQAELEKANAPQPADNATGEEKERIFKRGLLNDVATCFWIKARALEESKQNTQAREAYQAATKYTYARAWDVKGWFWRPAKDASFRLKHL